MFADFLIDGFPPMESVTTLSKIILRVHDKAQPQTIIDCRELAYRAREEHRFR
jgi:hypothetical protein